MLVHKGGQIKNVQLITEVGSAEGFEPRSEGIVQFIKKHTQKNNTKNRVVAGLGVNQELKVLYYL